MQLKHDATSEQEKQQAVGQKPMPCSSLLYVQPRAQSRAKLWLAQSVYKHFPLSGDEACG